MKLYSRERTVIDSISESNGDLGATCADAERFKCEQIDSGHNFS